MKPIAFLLFLSIWLVVPGNTLAQPPVGDPAYSELLEGLLDHSVPEAGIRDAAAMEDVIFLDTRSREEFNVSHLPAAEWVGYDEFNLDAFSRFSPDTPMVVYCSVGYRSEKVAEKLVNAGFKRVYNLYGGIFEWVNQGRVVTGPKGPTRRVHGYDRNWSRWLRAGEVVY